MIEVVATEDFKNARMIRGPHALANADFTAKMNLTGLEPGRRPGDQFASLLEI